MRSSTLSSFRAASRRFFRILLDTPREFAAINGPFLSAGLAFYVLLYCFPLLLLFVTALGYVLKGSEWALANVDGFVGELFPGSEQAVIDTLIGFMTHRQVLGVVSIGAFFVFGVILFGAVRHVLNCVFGVERSRTFANALGADVLALLSTGGLLALAAGLAYAVALSFELALQLPSVRSWIQPWWWAFVERTSSFAFSATLLYVLFRIAPAKCLNRRSLLLASLVGAVLLEASKWLFAGYVLSLKAYTGFYGALGGIVFFVLWIYYASSVFVFAATLGKVHERCRSG